MNDAQPCNKEISILLVEDERISREILGRIISLKFPAAKIFAAENGKDGLNTFRNCRADLVITDVSMPVMDGVAMSAEILKSAPGTDILITTAHCEIHGFPDALETGCFHLLQKPIKHEILFKAIQESIDRKHT